MLHVEYRFDRERTPQPSFYNQQSTFFCGRHLDSLKLVQSVIRVYPNHEQTVYQNQPLIGNGR